MYHKAMDIYNAVYNVSINIILKKTILTTAKAYVGKSEIREYEHPTRKQA